MAHPKQHEVAIYRWTQWNVNINDATGEQAAGSAPVLKISPEKLIIPVRTKTNKLWACREHPPRFSPTRGTEY